MIYPECFYLIFICKDIFEVTRICRNLKGILKDRLGDQRGGE
jgi:hypothetical protein